MDNFVECIYIIILNKKGDAHDIYKKKVYINKTIL